MNLIISPQNEYKMMLDFFNSGGTITEMPTELLKIRTVWKRADELFRKFKYYNNEKLAKLLMDDMPEQDMALSTAKAHISNAKKYYNFVEKETPETHKRMLTDILYQQIAMMEAMQLEYPLRADRYSKQIEVIVNRIASINKLYEKEETQTNERQGDLTIIFSSNTSNFDDIEDISDNELYTIIEEVTEKTDLSNKEKNRLISKDVKGNALK